VYLVEGYMDVVSLNSKGIENVVANLGTSLTDRQVSVLNQFYDDLIICFDGDESGYKAALRAAENLIKELKPEKQISFLFLPDKEDPDSFVNKNGKDYFIEFTKEKKISIHNFIFNHYKNLAKNNPSSLAIFEKKIRSIAYSIKDEFIKKYVLEFFLEKISSLTPNANQNKNKTFYKKAKSLKSTQKYFNETKNLSSIEIKEFSFLYLIINNLELVKNNLNLLENVKLFSNENKIIYDSLFKKLQSEQEPSINNLSLDPQILNKISKFASIKHILNKLEKDEFKVLELLEEIIRDIKNYELESRIEELESKFSKDLNENTFNEIKELKKLQKIN
jgi:DNA primase